MCRLPAASLLICLWLVERIQGDGSFQDSMAELHTRFAVSLYQTLAETENTSDLIVSPLSVSVSLGLLQLGARGNTLAQLEGTLGYNVKGRFRFFPPSAGDAHVGGGGTRWWWRACRGPSAGTSWYQVLWSCFHPAPAEHIGVWSHNTCIHTSANLINHPCSSTSRAQGVTAFNYQAKGSC